MVWQRTKREPDALTMWFKHRRSLWWKKWRWAVILVVAGLAVAVGYEILLAINYYHEWTHLQTLMPWFYSLAAFQRNMGLAGRPMLLAVCITSALLLQFTYFDFLLLQSEQLLAINEKALTARLRRMAIMQPLAVVALGVIAVFLIDFLLGYWACLGFTELIEPERLPVSRSAYAIGTLMFWVSTNPLIAIPPGICAALGSTLICILAVSKKIPVYIVLLPGTLYLSYWVIVFLLGHGIVTPMSKHLVYWLIIPLTILLAIISYVISHRPYWLRER